MVGSLFKGRDNIINDIRAKLSADAGEATAIVAKQAIHGLGGIGKTRLAVEYAWRCLSDYKACLFVIADSAENLDRNLAALCGPRLLNLPEQAEPQQELQVASVLRWFNLHSDWLLILDKVDSAEAAKAVDQLLPSLQGGQVLITSRRTDWGYSIRTLPLDTLADGDGVAFLLEKTMPHRTHRDSDAEDALALVNSLGGLALAIEQAGAFINKKRLSLAEYRERWDQQEKKLRHFPVKNYPQNLAVTWETSFEQLSSGAQALLKLLCWFSSDPIPRGPIKTAFDEVGADLLTPPGCLF